MDIYVQISEYLPLQTLCIVIDLFDRDLNIPEMKKWIQLKYHRSATIISRFMRRVHGVRHRTPEINSIYDQEDMTMYPLYLKRKYMQLYFFEYTKEYIRSWYLNQGNWKDQIKNQYQRKHFNHPDEITRWDLWELQKQMNLEEILVIGW